MKIRVSRLTDRENEDSQNCDEAISSYNQIYADALLSRQLKDEECKSLEQRVDALINKWDLMNHSKKSTFNSHCIQIPNKHEQSMQIGLIEVIENPLLYIKQPYLCVIGTLHRFHDRHQGKSITLAVNVSDEELGINQGITMFHTFSWCNRNTPQYRTDRVN